MKFICDKCKTKYSIADEKVRRKVLKIRCKNCSNIIEVRDPQRASGMVAAATGMATVLDTALEGAFESSRPTTRIAPGGAGIGRSGAVNIPTLQAVRGGQALARADSKLLQAQSLMEPEDLSTRMSLAPDIDTSALPAHDDEWYMALEGHQFGPMSFAELCSRVRRGEARAATGEEAFVWRDGFDDWVEVAAVPDLRPYVPPPPPHARGSGAFPLPTPDRPSTSSSLSVRAETRPPTIGAMSIAAASHGGSAVADPSFLPGSRIGHTGTATPVDENVATAAMAQPLLPPVGAMAAPMIAPAPAVVRKDPLARIAMIFSVLACMIGLALLYLNLVRPRMTTTHVVAPMANMSTPSRDEPMAQGVDAGASPELEFKPEEVDRGRVKAGRSTERAGGATESPTTAMAAATPTPDPKEQKLTAEQRRLLDLYKSGEGGDIPLQTPKQQRQTLPSRDLSAEEVGRAVQSSKPQITTCFERATKRDYSLRELRADVDLAISPVGRYKSVTINGVNDPQLVDCLRGVFRKWVFKPIGGDGQNVQFPLLLRGS